MPCMECAFGEASPDTCDTSLSYDPGAGRRSRTTLQSATLDLGGASQLVLGLKSTYSHIVHKTGDISLYIYTFIYVYT